MKTHHLIFSTALVFVVLFYKESMGLNLGIFGILLAIFTFYNTQEQNKTRPFLAVMVASVFSSIAFAWYADFSSFLAVFTSLFLLRFLSKNRELKSILVIPVMALNFITFIYRFFQFNQWVPMKKTDSFWIKFLAIFILPTLLTIGFFGIYTQGSTHFANLLQNYDFEIDFWQFVVLGLLGFFLAFNFWNFTLYNFIFKQNHYLKNDFLNQDKKSKPTYDFIDINTERLSGVVSFIGLNILLVFFIFTFNYEQFVEVKPSVAWQLSDETHERVGAVIMSIVMAILVILFYFKGSFNFDSKAKSLKILAKIWIILNIILVLSAFAKNTEYIINVGLTYRRLGVYTFLILSIIGLVFTFYKIKNKKTNAFLINQMIWYFYGTILLCSFINWGAIITESNMKRTVFDLNYHLYSVNYNENQLIDYANKQKNTSLKIEIKERLMNQKNKKMLSKNLYYENIIFTIKF